jgi:hypothetical protein
MVFLSEAFTPYRDTHVEPTFYGSHESGEIGFTVWREVGEPTLHSVWWFELAGTKPSPMLKNKIDYLQGSLRFLSKLKAFRTRSMNK